MTPLSYYSANPMTRLLHLKRILLLAFVPFIFAISGCDNRDCQAPPPTFYFRIADAALTYPADLDSGAVIRISYIENGQKNYINDIRKADDILETWQIIPVSRKLNDPEFTFELDGRVLTKLKLKTYVNNSECSGWEDIS